MSQKILNAKWYDKFVAQRVDKEYARELARRLQNRVQYAMDVLDKTPIGDEVVFEGSCPSGNTYEGYFTWDGTSECREKIAEKAYRLGGFNASAAWLVAVKNVRQGIFAANLRTGDY